MADIKQITLPSGSTYNIKDEVAREMAAGSIRLIEGTTTTPLEDGATTNPIIVNGESYTVTANEGIFYGDKEFVFDGTYWHEFGDMSGLGELAKADTASAEYTPQGTVSVPTISVGTAGTTSAFTTGLVTAAPSATAPSNPITYYNVQNEILTFYQIGYDTAQAKTGDASYTASQPAFTGTEATITVQADE